MFSFGLLLGIVRRPAWRVSCAPRTRMQVSQLWENSPFNFSAYVGLILVFWLAVFAVYSTVRVPDTRHTDPNPASWLSSNASDIVSVMQASVTIGCLWWIHHTILEPCKTITASVRYVTLYVRACIILLHQLNLIMSAVCSQICLLVALSSFGFTLLIFFAGGTGGSTSALLTSAIVFGPCPKTVLRLC